jgi:hypothetical protein
MVEEGRMSWVENGRRVVCVIAEGGRWVGPGGSAEDGPRRGTHWTIAGVQRGTFLDLAEWPGNSVFEAKWFRPLDPDAGEIVAEALRSLPALERV